MDVLSFIKNNGLKEIPNPNYNPRSKKNTGPRTLTVADIDFDNDPLLNLTRNELRNQFSINASETEKYRKAGINWNPIDAANGSLDRQLAESQSASRKLINGLKQSIVSEIGIGTIKAFSDIIDSVGQAIGTSDHDYSNPVSRKLEEWQEYYRNEVAPIYTTPGVDIANGGFGDAGWWASNMPSIMSSLTLLIPSSGIVKGVGYLGKAAKTSTVGKAVGKTATSAAKWSARATRLDRLDDAKKAYGFLTSSQGQALINEGTKVAATAALSRTMENYQEARQVYDDMYAQASQELANMKPEDYAKFLERNASVLEGVDTNNKDEVAKAVARTSADRTFAIDYLNTVSDIIQVYALRNMLKGVKNIGTNSKILREHKNSLAQLAAKNTGKEFIDKTTTSKDIRNWFVDNLFASKTVIAGELSEGIEEAVNYVAQQEGMNLGSVMLDASKDSKLATRLGQYGKEPGLYESAFWGVLGGVVFHGLGSGFKRAELAIDKYIDYKKRKEDPKTKEKVTKPSWSELWEMPEYKRRTADIEARNADLYDYINKLQMIEDGKNPYETDETGQSQQISKVQKDYLKEKAYTDMITNMTLRAMDSGNYDLLKEYLKSDEVKQALVQSGLVTEAEATAYQQNAEATMTKLEEKYDENIRVLNRLSARINRKREEPIPIEYLQIIARNNINHQLQIEDWQRQLDAYEIDATKQENFFRDKLDPSINYKDAVRLTFLTAQLGELEADKKELLKDKEKLNTIEGQQELESINKNIETYRDIIYNINPNEGISNLLFAIGNSFSFERFGKEAKSNLSNSQYLSFRDMLANLEKEEDSDLQSQASEYFAKTDKRLTNITGAQLQQSKVLDDTVRRAHDVEQGISEVATDLHQTYMHIAYLQTAIALERGQIAITEKEVLNEVNNLHNFMNKARKEAINQAKNNLIKLADKYGDLAVRNALYRKYNGNTVETNYFGETDEDLANGKLFNDATDILHLDSDANRNLLGIIDNLLVLNRDIKAAQSQSSSTSEKATQASQNSQTNNTSEQTIEEQETANAAKIEGITEQQGQPLEQTQSAASNEVIELKDGEEVYARLIPNTGPLQGYHLEVVPTTAGGVNLLNDDRVYTKNGVSLTEDYVITERPLVDYKNGAIVPLSRGTIAKATPENVEQSNAEQSQISSTGVVDKTSTKPEPKTTTKANTEKEDITVAQVEQTSDDELVSKASEEIKTAVMSAIKKETSIDWETLKNSITEKYVKQADNQAEVERLIDINIKSFKGIYTRRVEGKTTKVDKVAILSSSITEKTKQGRLLEDYHKAVNELVEKYKEDVAIDYRNGKYYVRISDLLRYCNEQAGTTAMADMIYQNLLTYMNNSDKFEVIDVSLEDALNNSKQSIATRKNILTNTNNLYGINFDGYVAELLASGLNHEANKVLDIIDNLNLGDKISYRASDNVVIFTVGDTVIGSLPLPKTDGLPLKGVKQVGQKWQYNDDWTTDVLINPNGSVSSELKELFRKWLTQLDNANISELNDIILQVAFDKKLDNNSAELKKLANKFMKNAEVIAANKKGFIRPDADPVKLLKGIAKIWGYTRQIIGDSVAETNEIRELSLDGWFETQVVTSFEMVESLHTKGTGTVTVGFISDGELIKTEPEDRLPASQAIGSKHKGKIKLAVAESIGNLTIAGDIDGETSLKFSGIKGGVSKYSTVVVIPSRSGRHGYVHAYGANITSKQVKGKAKEVVKAALAEIRRIGKEGTPEQIGEALQSYLMLLLNSGNNGNTPLFRTNGSGTFGVQDFNYKDNGKFGFQINYKDVNGAPHWFTISWKGHNEQTGTSSRKQLAFHNSGPNGVIENTDKAIDELIKVISENTNFNLDIAFIKSDNNKNIDLSRSLAKRTKDGKFVIDIPNQGEFVFNSYNDFIIENDLVSLTTKPTSNGSNYNRQSVTGNQAANQALKVRTEFDTTTPVEENEDTTPITKTTTAQDIRKILDGYGQKRTAARRIAKLILGEKVKNLKIDNKLFDLFPQNIKFVDENLGEIATVNVGNDYSKAKHNENVNVAPGQVVVGKEWLKLVNGSVAEKKQAVRKLIHERLHLILHSDGNNKYIEQIREIFNEFEAKNTNEDLKQYLYHDNETEYYTDGKINTKGLEEFLVETLTSQELAQELNNIQSENVDKTKKKNLSLLQKIMKLLSDMFEWGITEGSLYAKEFNLLQDMLTPAPTTTILSENYVQGELNFDEPVTNETVEKEQEIKPSDSMSFGDEFSDLFSSAIQEKEQTTTSVPTFVNKFPVTQQADVVEKINNGEIEIRCN